MDTKWRPYERDAFKELNSLVEVVLSSVDHHSPLAWRDKAVFRHANNSTHDSWNLF